MRAQLVAELLTNEAWIRRHLSDYSSMHYRACVLREIVSRVHTLPAAVHAVARQLLWREFALSSHMLALYTGHEALWYMRRALAGLLSPAGVSACGGAGDAADPVDGDMCAWYWHLASSSVAADCVAEGSDAPAHPLLHALSSDVDALWRPSWASADSSGAAAASAPACSVSIPAFRDVELRWCR